MNLFKQLESTAMVRPQRMLIYGMPGIGTSSFAAGLPSPVFVPADDSTSHIRCARFPVAKRFGDLMQALEELYIEPHDYRTVVVDPLDAVERLIRDEVSRHQGAKPSNETPQAAGQVLTYWRRLLRRLDLLRDDIGLHVVLVARAQARRAAADSESDGSSARLRYRPVLCRRAAALAQIWSDDILFATHAEAARAVIGSSDAQPGDGPSDNARVICTTSSPHYMAKNHLHLPQQLTFDPAALLPYLQPAQAVTSNLN
jgi:hypothetical protein